MFPRSSAATISGAYAVWEPWVTRGLGAVKNTKVLRDQEGILDSQAKLIQELDGLAMVERPLAEGVERINFAYGIDVGNDGVADRFVAGQDDSSKRYDLDGDGTADFDCGDVVGTEPRACEYKRALFSQLIQVRNIAFRRGG